MTPHSAPRLQMLGITKRFPGVTALRNVSLTLNAGECLGLIGENGAGKSTLIKILGGIVEATAGEIQLDGQTAQINTPGDATDRGIRIIHQELNLCDDLDVTENIFLGRERTFGGPLRMIDRPAMRHAARRLCDRVGLSVPLDRPAGDLSTGMRQLVEIARALAVNARVLVLDEPTSSLSTTESERLFDIVRSLKTEGVSIIYVSHRMQEILDLTDRVVCLRDGERVAEVSTHDTNQHDLVHRMVGRKVDTAFKKRTKPPGEPALEVSGLRFVGSPHRYDFTVGRGEVLGLAGIVGAGRTELAQALFGIHRHLAGEIRVEGEPVAIGSPRDAIRSGIGLVPEDRRRHGLVLPMTVLENLVLGLQGKEGPARLKRCQRFQNVAENQIAALRIKTPSADTMAMNLSGGNQQKVVLGKWLAVEPKVFILDEPTRGIDIGAKQEIYRLINALAQKGIAIVLISSEMEEIIGLSDRVLVMHESRIVDTLAGDRINETQIAQLSAGLNE